MFTLKTDRTRNIEIILTLIILVLGCSQKETREIFIRRVDYELETPFRIDCSRFESEFSSDLTSIRIVDVDAIERIEKEIQIAKKLEDGWKVDVRAKIYLMNGSNGLDTLCANKFIFVKGGSVFELSENLRDLLW